MCSDTDQYDRICKGEFREIHTKLDRLDVAIRGNGKRLMPTVELR
jgi:hypothetical protein